MGTKFGKVNWRRLGFLLLWVFSITGVFVLMSFIAGKGNKQQCTAVHIIVPGTQAFVSQADVYNEIEATVGPLVGHILKEVPVQEIEDKMTENPFVKEVSVYNDLDGKVNVKIAQREAVLRVMNEALQDFYIDANGVKFPTSKRYAPHVIVANGYIAERFNGKQDSIQTVLLNDLYKVAKHINADSLWNSQIEQLYVNEDKDIELVPRVGNQRIVLGTADSIDKKLSKLLIFYKRVVPKVGWGTYKSVNLKFADQLVCEKADSIINKEKNNKQHINTH